MRTSTIAESLVLALGVMPLVATATVDDPDPALAPAPEGARWTSLVGPSRMVGAAVRRGGKALARLT